MIPPFLRLYAVLRILHLCFRGDRAVNSRAAPSLMNGVTGLSPLWSQAVQGSGESEQTVGCLLVCCASCIVQCLCCQHVSESQSRHRSRWHRRLAASQFCLLVQQDGDKNQTPSRAEKVPEQNKVNANNFRQQILSGFMAPRTLKI